MIRTEENWNSGRKSHFGATSSLLDSTRTGLELIPDLYGQGPVSNRLTKGTAWLCSRPQGLLAHSPRGCYVYFLNCGLQNTVWLQQGHVVVAWFVSTWSLFGVCLYTIYWLAGTYYLSRSIRWATVFVDWRKGRRTPVEVTSWWIFKWSVPTYQWNMLPLW